MAPPLLTLTGARLRIGRQQLLDRLDAVIGKGDRIVLVGRNGAGKSTLLQALAGEIELDEGERFVQPRTSIAHLEQEPRLSASGTLADYVVTGLPASERSESAYYRADVALQQLGLAPLRDLIGLSGGETRRAALARTLVSEPDILLLDEPTNHLDLTAIEWLEERLSAFTGALVLISHDRWFLERLSRTTWWLDRGRLRVLDQGYAAFDDWSEQVLEAEAADLARLDKRLEVETAWLHKGVTARRRRNQGRLRRLGELREQRRRHIGVQGSVQLRAETASSGGQLVIETEAVSKGFGGEPVVREFSTRILKSDRVGIVGPNGAGKTTLLSLLTGELAPDSGRVRLGTNLEIARFDQRRQSLDPTRTLWQTLCPDGGDKVQVGGQWRHVVGYLKDFLFRDEQARQQVGTLSGGERSRLLLAMILAKPANLLVLDEPTNDLDLDTLELLEEMLGDWPGTLLLVSHDRRFLDRLVTSTIAFEGRGRWREYAGGYSDWLAQRPAPAPVSAPPRPTPPKPVARAGAARGFDTKLQRELDRLPDKLAKVQQAIAATEARLADTGLYTRDPAGFGMATAELEKLRVELHRLEERWLELELQREGAAAGQ